MLPINYFVRNEILVHVNKYSWHNRKATHLKYKKYFKGTIFEIITYIKDNEAPKTICLTVVPRLGYKQHIKISKRYFLWSCRLWLHILLGSFLDEQISIAIWENFIFFLLKTLNLKMFAWDPIMRHLHICIRYYASGKLFWDFLSYFACLRMHIFLSFSSMFLIESPTNL